MLGVLSIIAVLTLTALGGYSYAVGKHRANMILNDIKLIVTIALSTDFLNTYKEASATPKDLTVDTAAPYPYNITKETAQTFVIETKQVQKNTCTRLTDNKPDYVEEIAVNVNSSGKCDDSNNNNVYFYINGELNTHMQNPDRYDRCDETIPCKGTCADCVDGRCIDNNAKCPNGQFCVAGECSDCQKGYIKDTAGRCQKCDAATVSFTTTAEECNKCSGRFLNNNNQCSRCDASTAYFWHTTLTECNKCSIRSLFGSETDGQCARCDTPEKITSGTKEQCDKCQRKYTTSGWQNLCVLPTDNACDGLDGSACELENKSYKGVCVANSCSDLGMHPSLPWSLADEYCKTQGGLPSVKELTAISANPLACNTNANYQKDDYHVCPTDDSRKNEYQSIPSVSGQAWTNQKCSYYPDYWVVTFSNGNTGSANWYVYSNNALCRSYLP